MIQPILQTSQGCDHPSSEVKLIFMIYIPTINIRRDVYNNVMCPFLSLLRQELFSLHEGGHNSPLSAIFVAGS